MELDTLQFDSVAPDLEEEGDLKSVTRQIFTSQSDPEIDSLYNKWKRGKLVVQPNFQRYFVWDHKRSSRLIESALLDIPLPVIYISQEKDGKEYIIDGQQRLTSFFSFIDGRFPDATPFRLSDLNVFDEYNKSLFAELSEDAQDKIKYCKIRTVTFRKESDSNLKFEIFKRLNTGSVSLNDQELRNCIYRGPYNDLLRQLASNKEFQSLMGLRKPDKRMRDVELVLRFAAFYHQTYLKYKPPMRSFLNKEMEEYQFLSKTAATELEEAFKTSVYIIKSVFGENAFKRYYKGDNKNPNGHWEPKKFNTSLFDILMYSFSKEDKNHVFRNLETIRESLIFLMTSDQDFINSIELSTSSIQAVTIRFDKWRSTLQALVGVHIKEPRCFSRQLKQEMFDLDPTCQICKQRIQTIDDAAIDHIEQYWRGGQTIPENARLTHRYCKWARPRNE